jgi:probable rRNA maturation factor
VIISYPQAMRQAEKQGHPPKDELTILAIHGVLHLLGYDHEHSKQEKEMRAKEAKILANLRYI